MIKVIVFDAGGVMLITESYVKYLKRTLALDDARLAKLKRLYIRAERGEMGSKKLERELERALGVGSSGLEWPEMVRRDTKVDINVRRLVIRLAKRYKVALLTNMVKDRYIWLVRQSIIERELFDYIFVSSYMRMSKPSRSIYISVLERLGAAPEEVVFIDNRIENVDAARALNINALHYTGYAQLEHDLRKLGVKW
ncbi:MAG: HAD family phosphatase [Candidatus Micrarchaeota archaeon]|nr:HAD family phosphatase [Candidatus Micrarchaeota archaeon]